MRYSQGNYYIRHDNKKHKLKTLTNVQKYCIPLENATIYEDDTLIITIENNTAIATISKYQMICNDINYLKSTK